MLRNAGVNVTEHKIREEVEKAYEYDYFHECSKRAWRRDHDVQYAGYKTMMRRQPRYYYRSMPRHLPPYCQSARSSISSYARYSELDEERMYGVKRIYLPERDLGESSYFIRKPCYKQKYHSNSRPHHTDAVERPLKRDFGLKPDSPRRTSSVCVDENRMERLIDATRCLLDNYCPKIDFAKYKKPIKKMTRKLSPIFTCDCTVPFGEDSSKRTYSTKLDSPLPTHKKAKSNNLSKEAKKLSQDIFNLLSLLQKAEAEEEEQYSSDSVLQQVHNFDCSSTNNVTRRKTDLITEHVQIYPKMEKKIQDPLTKLKNITGVRSKLEELVNILKQCENNSGSKADIVQKNDPSSPGDESFQAKDKTIKTCNYETKECRKDIVLQTEEPKTSNKSICSRIKRSSSVEVMRLLKSRFSTKAKEKANSKKGKFNDKKKVKEDEANFDIKKTSLDKTLLDNEASKQNLTNASREIKTGLMITIGGKVLRKKLAAPENRLNRMSNTWIKKYLDTKPKKVTKDIHQRWNNRAFYNRSSTTVVEVINNVYKQMGINLKSKYNDTSRNPHLKSPAKSAKKTRHRQTIEAYMMPQMVMHPVCMPEDIITKSHVTSIKTLLLNEKPPLEQNIYLINDCSMYSNILNSSNDANSIFFRIYVAKDYLDSVSSSNQTLLTSDERVHKIVEREVTKSDVFNNALTGNGSLECDEPAAVHDMEKDDVQVFNDGFLSECEVGENIVTQENIQQKTAKPEYQMQEPVSKESKRLIVPHKSTEKEINNIPDTEEMSGTSSEEMNGTSSEEMSGTSSEAELKLKLTSEGKIANIYLSNDKNLDNKKYLLLTYQQISQENVAHNKVVKQIVKPIIKILNNSVKIHFSIENVKVKGDSENQIYDDFPKNAHDTCHIKARFSDSAVYKSKLNNDNCSKLFRQISDHFYCKWINPLYDNSVKPSCAAEPIIRKISSKLQKVDFQVNTNSSLDHCDIIEEYVTYLLGEKGKTIEDNLNRVEETTCMLDAMTIMNANVGANISYANEELITNVSYSSIGPHNISMHKGIVSMFSKLIKDNKTDILEQQTHDSNNENGFLKSKIISVRNILAKTLNHTRQNIVTKSKSYLRQKKYYDNNCQLDNKKTSKTFSISSMRLSIKRNAVGTETQFSTRKYNIDGIGTSYRELNSNIKCPKKDKLNTKLTQTFSKLIPYVRANSLKKIHNKMQINSGESDASSEASLLVKPYKSQENLYLIEHNDTFQNKSPVKIDDDSNMLSYDPINDILNKITDQADILQSHIVKKAVLHLYTEEQPTRKDYLVVKLPEYMSL